MHEVEIQARPSLLRDAEREIYEALQSSVEELLKPANALERIWVRDLVDLQYELVRLRHLKACFLDSVRHRARHALLADIDPALSALCSHFIESDGSDMQIDDRLRAAGMTNDHVEARAFSMHFQEVDRFDQAIMRAEARRNSAFRELERYRAGLAAKLRQIEEQLMSKQSDLRVP